MAKPSINIVPFYTLQEIIRTILYNYQFIWYITVRGTPKVLVIVIINAFFLCRVG